MNITWWGHATATVTIGGVRVLTDPLFASRLAHLRRQVPSVPPEAALADVAVVSHLHPDHLHLPSLRRLRPSTRLVVPRGGAAVLGHQVDLPVDEVTPGDVLTFHGIELVATAAHHDGRRLPGSTHHGPALGFVLRSAESSVWFAGDTGLFASMEAIGPVDVALVPVGGWGPTLGPHHLDPEEAALAVQRVHARDAVPIHYGTYWPAGLRRAAPAQYQRACLRPGERFGASADGFRAHVLAPGGSVDL